MENTLTVSEARKELLKISKKFSGGKARAAIPVTRQGKPVLALVPWELYDSLMETLEILSDKEAAEQLQKSLEEAAKGKTIPLAKLKKDLGL